jgi:hypothetical protein
MTLKNTIFAKTRNVLHEKPELAAKGELKELFCQVEL